MEALVVVGVGAFVCCLALVQQRKELEAKIPKREPGPILAQQREEALLWAHGEDVSVAPEPELWIKGYEYALQAAEAALAVEVPPCTCLTEEQEHAEIEALRLQVDSMRSIIAEQRRVITEHVNRHEGGR
jgi:hypothetical protein